jgi:hypothetical protein
VKIETRKLDKDMNGPDYFAIASEAEFVHMGYVWEFRVYSGDYCVRAGASKIKDEAKLREYLESGMNRLEWEAIHGKD